MKLFTRNKPKAGKNASGGSRDFQAEELAKQSMHTPIHQKLATHGSNPTLQQTQIPQQQKADERWEVVAPPDQLVTPQQQQQQQMPSRTASQNSLTHPAIAIASTGQQIPQQQRAQQQQQRSASPMSLTSVANGQKPQSGLLKKKPPTTAPVAMSILRSLEPPRGSDNGHNQSGRGSQSEEYLVGSDSGHGPPAEKKEKRGFWGGSKDKDRDREREREKERERERDREMYTLRERESMHRERPQDEGPAELTRMIGYLTATASEDWTLVLEVCDRASSSESNAKDAVRALRREFKYGEPPAQLSAARLWAIMLRNSSDTFISQSTSRKFLDTLEDLLQSGRTSPVVRERLLEVVAAAAYASGAKKDPRENREGFKGLWRRVKPFDKPDEGVPFDTDDAMFNPPMSGRVSGYEMPMMQYQEPSPLPDANNNPPSTPANAAIPSVLTPGAQPPPAHTIKKKKSPPGGTGNRIIPREEDIRRLFQECNIGQGNASLLSQALALSKPEDLEKKSVIKEFFAKCRSSQELIFAQIPWASAGAERSRAEADSLRMTRTGHARTRTMSNNDLNGGADAIGAQENGDEGSPTDGDETLEEKLLAALLLANEELMEALKQYDDLFRIALERKAEERSRKDARRALKQQQQQHLQREYNSSNITVPVEQEQQYEPPSRTESPSNASVGSSRPPSPLPPGATTITPYQLAPSSTVSVPYTDHTAHEGYHQPAPMPQHQQQHPQYLQQQQHQLPQAPPHQAQQYQPQPHQHQYLQQQQQQQLQQRGLAPPMAAPHGPRSPGHVGAAASVHSRASSPGTPKLEPTTRPTAVIANGHPQDLGDDIYDDADDASELDMTLEAPAGLGLGTRRYEGVDARRYEAGDAYRDATAYRDRDGDAYGTHRGKERARDPDEYEEEEWERPVQPSAKALGKRKLVEPEPRSAPAFDPDDLYYDGGRPFGPGDATEPEFEDEADARARRPPVTFVYDAVAERSRQIQQQLEMQKAAAALTLNPVSSAH